MFGREVLESLNLGAALFAFFPGTGVVGTWTGFTVAYYSSFNLYSPWE